MIEPTRGDLLRADAEAIVNTVNCAGVMGRGLAEQFSRAYPANLRAYQLACKRGEVVPGRMFIVETGKSVGPRYIINFPTKRHWRDASRLADIESGLVALVADVERLELRSIAVPPLGCGRGQAVDRAGLRCAARRPGLAVRALSYRRAVGAGPCQVGASASAAFVMAVDDVVAFVSRAAPRACTLA